MILVISVAKEGFGSQTSAWLFTLSLSHLAYQVEYQPGSGGEQDPDQHGFWEIHVELGAEQYEAEHDGQQQRQDLAG